MRAAKRGVIRGGVSFEWFTQESMARGDYEDAGWEREPEEMSFREATDLVRAFEPYHHVHEVVDAKGGGRLDFAQSDPERNFRDGSETYREVTLYFEDTITMGRFLMWWKSYAQRGRR